jgi:uncharacterized protein YkwD
MGRSVNIALRIAVLFLVFAFSSAALAGWDLTKPLTEFFPPPLAVEPESEDPSVQMLKSSGPTLEDQIMELTNQERWDNGQLPPLKRCSLLDDSAETHSVNMGNRNFFAHCDLDTGSSPFDRIAAAGYSYTWAGENLHVGSSTAAGAIAGWMSSPGHRANILRAEFRELGVGYHYDASDTGNIRFDSDGDCDSDNTIGPYYHYWTQNFGSRSTVYPVIINREAYSTATVDVDLYLYGSGWASEMRIRNEGGNWTAWQTFASDVEWQLSAGPGVKQVFVEIRNGGAVRDANDSIVSTAPGASPEIFDDDFEEGHTGNWSSTVQ